MDCFTKIVTLQELNDIIVVFREERNVIPDYMISAMTI
jgi:hypothetical protein